MRMGRSRAARGVVRCHMGACRKDGEGTVSSTGKHEELGLENLSLRAGTAVHCTDGRIGTLQGADHDPATGRTTVLRVVLDGSRDVLSLPAELVESTMDDGGIRLSISTRQLEEALEDLHPARLAEGQSAPAGGGVEAPSDPSVPLSYAPEMPRPLWYRAAGTLEPLRPAFVWVVENRQVVQLAGLAALAVAGGVLSTVAGQRVGAVARRRLGR